LCHPDCLPCSVKNPNYLLTCSVSASIIRQQHKDS